MQVGTHPTSALDTADTRTHTLTGNWGRILCCSLPFLVSYYFYFLFFFFDSSRTKEAF